MKKGVIILCMVMAVVFSMTNAAFADTSVPDAISGNMEISDETIPFLYGDWKVETFLGSQIAIKDDAEYSGGEKLLGKIVRVKIGLNQFSTFDLAPEEKYAVHVEIGEYNVTDSMTGKEFTSNYKVSEDVTKIKDGDQVQVIQAVPEDKKDPGTGPMLVDVNNKRLIICLNRDYFELAKNFWTDNDMSVEIYDPRVNDDGAYHVVYHHNEAELVPEADIIRLLMINGGFVPYPDIKVVNNRTLVPLRVVSELLGARVDWDEKRKTIAITEEGTKISLAVNSVEASINGRVKTLDVPPAIMEGKTYVPVRFIAEALSADVGYVSSVGGDSQQKIENGVRKAECAVSVVTIEKPNRSAKVYSADEGLVKVKEASAAEYQALLDYLKKGNRTFESGAEDYDSQDIAYTNQMYGRYYVYRLAAFPQENIFFNKYTGEIYSECDGLPFLFISKGFINIGWSYQ